MKRSEINRILKSAKDFFRKQKFELPPWAFWSRSQWLKTGSECDEIRKNRLGWDISDFGSGDFKKIGLLLFTLRNGSYGHAGKPYAEKIMVCEPKQVTPIHFHWSKTEDIINRGGGDLAIRLWMADKNEKLSKLSFSVQIDGISRNLKAGSLVKLKPGESITLTPYLYHSFWAEKSKCLVGEVSMVNDDSGDNRFLRQTGRFPVVDEDVEPLHLLCTEYPSAKTSPGIRRAACVRTPRRQAKH